MESTSSTTYLRFATIQTDEESLVGTGIFQAAYKLRNGGQLPANDHSLICCLLSWFCEQLQSPDENKLTDRAIFWFKPGADRLLAMGWEIAALLRKSGQIVELVKTRRPGYVMW